ncbi:MAG: ABC transporter permease [Xanthomonadales bacterium]|nr:ABC transporter permease [Xanthomonadales bacterium]
MSGENLVALGTVTRREVMRILRIWTQTLLPSAITMTLYFVIFGTMIGRRIGEMAPGIGYIDYIVPGLIMMAVITNCYGNISSSFFGSKFGRYVEEMLASPMPGWVILSGYVAGAVLRGVMVAIIVLAISLAFTDIHLHHPLATLATVLLTAIVFSLAGFVNAVFAQKFDDIALVPTFVLAPLTYLGGVFYSVNALGSPWREISYANPVLYMVNAFRHGLLGISDVPLGVAFAVMVGLAVVLGALSLYLLKRGVGLRS